MKDFIKNCGLTVHNVDKVDLNDNISIAQDTDKAIFSVFSYWSNYYCSRLKRLYAQSFIALSTYMFCAIKSWFPIFFIQVKEQFKTENTDVQ